METFSQRFGHSRPDAEITIRNEAPGTLRQAVIAIAYASGLSGETVRKILCELLRKLPDPTNWSADNIQREVSYLIDEIEWFEVYDLIEAISGYLRRARMHYSGQPAAEFFDNEINSFFRTTGFGWQVSNGVVEIRGTEAFEVAMRQAHELLVSAGRSTASGELHEAIADLSRRPRPEITGAIQHAMAALECVARDVSISKETLGAIVKNNPGLFPTPVGAAVSSTWGYSSNFGRHLQEGQSPDFDEAELVVGLSGVLCRYLTRKYPNRTRA